MFIRTQYVRIKGDFVLFSIHTTRIPSVPFFFYVTLSRKRAQTTLTSSLTLDGVARTPGPWCTSCVGGPGTSVDRRVRPLLLGVGGRSVAITYEKCATPRVFVRLRRRRVPSRPDRDFHLPPRILSSSRNERYAPEEHCFGPAIVVT